MLFQKLRKLSAVQLLSLGFSVIILLGTVLLMLPISSASGQVTPLFDALLTATSATCVTGLVVYDTATYWSTVGQLIILVLIQIGGLGFMTILVSALSVAGKRIGIKQRIVMQESIAGQQMGGIVHMGRFILVGVFGIEAMGAILLSVRFIPLLGVPKGIFYSIFHAVSAFCNAGFDLMGYQSPFSSLTYFADDWYFTLVIMLLIIVGGLGFFVWNDILQKRGRLRKFSLHSKIVLITTVWLLVGGAIVFFALEWQNPALGDNMGARILSAIFQSVTTRTAGFNTIDLTALQESSLLLTSLLMLVGGSPGSTAGGMKTTTLAILILSVLAEFRSRKSIECFNRRVSDALLRQACCIAVLYIGGSVVSGVIIAAIEKISLSTALFETVSAIGTVGLSLGLTPTLSLPSKLIITALMFIGRVGGFTLLLTFATRAHFTQSQLPLEKVNVG